VNRGAVIFAACTVIFWAGFLSFMYLYVAPEGRRKSLQREAEQQASIDGPKVLLELVGEMRVLRSEVGLLISAVESLAAQ
jgi:hypothetical protein